MINLNNPDNERERIETLSKIYLGKTYGSLEVLEFDHMENGRVAFFKCKCNECGEIISVRADHIIKGKSSKCKCINAEPGMIFGKLKVLEDLGNKEGQRYYKCECTECGWVGEVSRDILKNGKSVKCNCTIFGQPFAIGKTFGKLKVLEDLGLNDNGTQQYYKCECTECKWIGAVRVDEIKNYGKTNKCNCSKSDTKKVRGDITGMTFNGVEVISLSHIDKHHHSKWNCKCPTCGEIFQATKSNLMSGKTSQCFKCARESAKKNLAKDLTGMRFGDCVVMCKDEEAMNRRKSNATVWLAKCDCGNIFSAVVNEFTSGKVTCCPECSKACKVANEKRFYNIYQQMKSRCNNPNSTAYIWYGGRDTIDPDVKNISVCPDWNYDYNRFKEDMYESYLEHIATHDSTTIDRIDPNKDYCKENCRWATMTEQDRNKRCTPKFYIPEYGLLSIQDIIDLGIPDTPMTYSMIYHRVFILGLSIFDAIYQDRSKHVRKMISFDNEE